MSRKLKLPKKKSSKLKKKSGKMPAPSLAVSSSVPTPAGNVSGSAAKNEDTAKSLEMSKKAQCDLCKLSYATEKELTEHLLSLMHHTKMEDKEENPVHACTLCSVTCTGMAGYRMHITSNLHQRKLSILRGGGENMSRWNGRRGGSVSGSSAFSGHSKQSRGRVLQGNKTQDYRSQFGKNNKSQDSHIRFQSHGSGRGSSQFQNRGWNDLFRSENDSYRWSRGQVNNKYSMDMGVRNGGRGILETPQANKCYEPWGSGVFGDYYEYHKTGGFLMPWKRDNKQEGWRINHARQKETSGQLKSPVVSNTIPGTWTEQLLLQQERFLAGMDEVYFPTKHHSQLEPNPAGTEIHNYSSAVKNKRPRSENAQEAATKPSRSVDFCFDGSIPLRQDHKRQKIAAQAPYLSAPVLSTDVYVHTQISTIDRGILEKAEHLCEELRENQESFRAEQNLLKNTDCEVGNKKLCVLKQKQQSYQKGDTRVSERPQSREKYNSHISSASTLQSPNSDPSPVSASRGVSTNSLATTSQPNASGNALDEIKKSIEKSVLEKPQTKSLAPSKAKQIRCSSGGAEPSTASEGKDVTVGRPLSKLTCKSHLTKDSIKKIVNAPNSRDERLQLAKMLQSRDEHKMAASSALRTNLQLEGLHDSVVSQEVNVDVNQNCDVQTIKLEDLSDSVRNQILNLIGEDITNKFGSQSEPETSKVSVSNELGKGALHSQDVIVLQSQKDVIVLSDDEDLRKRSKHEKKISSISTPAELSDVKKAKKKNSKKLAGPSSKTSLGSSMFMYSVDRSAASRPILVSNSKKNVQAKPVQQLPKQPKERMCTGSDVEVVTCSSDTELGKKKGTFSRKKTSHDSIVYESGQTSSPLSTSAKGDIFSVKELSGDKNQSQNRLRATEEFSAPVNLPKGEEALPVKKGTDISSEVDSSSQSLKQLLPNESCHISDAPLASSSVQANLPLSSPYTDTGVRSPSSDMSVQSLLPPSDMVSSSLHTGVRPSSPDTVMRSSPDAGPSSSLSLTAQQTSSAETTLSWPSPQRASSHVQTSHMLTLPPSTWLRDRNSPSHRHENNHISASNKSSSTVKDPKAEDTSVVVTVIADDEDNNTVGSKLLPDIRMSSAASADINESSSRVMSELLVLSEREEDVKQEKMSLDLRLSRLHKLLEQAVVQINKCTERRKLLHEEEQELSRQRLLLLREAASLKPNRMSDAADVNSQTVASRCTSDDQSQAFRTDQCGLQSSVPMSTSTSYAETSVIASSSGENPQGTFLSRADWLAKFSSYLPHDADGEENQITVARAFSLASHSALKKLVHHSSVPVSSLNSSLPSIELIKERGTNLHQVIEVMKMKNQQSCDKFLLKPACATDQPCQLTSSETNAGNHKNDVNLQSPDEGSVVTSSTGATAGRILPNNIIATPIMYLGSFKSADASLSESTDVGSLAE